MNQDLSEELKETRKQVIINWEVDILRKSSFTTIHGFESQKEEIGFLIGK